MKLAENRFAHLIEFDMLRDMPESNESLFKPSKVLGKYVRVSGAFLSPRPLQRPDGSRSRSS